MSVRCVDCGYLTTMDGREPVEVLDQWRAKFPDTALTPLCLVRQRVFEKIGDWGEVDAAGHPDPIHNPYATQVLEKHDCDRFIEHEMGKSPQDHRSMEVLAQVRAENEAFQRRAQENADARHKENLLWTRIIGCVAVLSLIVSAVAIYVGTQ